MSSLLTRDNLHLSRPKTGGAAAKNLTAAAPSLRVNDYVREALSENTRRAYRTDLRHFLEWGGDIPATDAMVAEYLADHAGILAVATLKRRVASIAKGHAMKGFASPTSSALVQSTLRGIIRAHGSPQKAAKPLLVEDLLRIMPMLGEGMKDSRDRALLLVGFAGGFRRSELVALNCSDLEWVRQGLVVRVRRSKTDQEGVGRKVGIPHARGRWCPVEALRQWLEEAGIEDGAVFRPVDRHRRVADTRLSGEAVSLLVKERAAALGMDPAKFSGHSLRAGLATSAALVGVSSWKIRQQTGHASDAMVARYIREGELFVGNAVGALL